MAENNKLITMFAGEGNSGEGGLGNYIAPVAWGRFYYICNLAGKIVVTLLLSRFVRSLLNLLSSIDRFTRLSSLEYNMDSRGIIYLGILAI